ncbi:biotin carboxylase N-terminal domain-containing protein [Leekyejoonella antrihumi]|uniref:Biotin/lipoyl-binding protein n=1 Tax=Leekyejoonella antrihumi TaxID=1660198 RepID=A0A563DW55_9MICO|nr:biotin carboxylase N-terminal domain-containing protein [Leekyejoonella antrihumi]TWP33954.1 biotin/lipoyl-binding protein [Leekyejoonella antrihumi]
MISSVLVANRGEIARRVFATCRARGLATVAVFSDADAHSPHVAEADRAVRLPGNAPADTYLRGDLIVAAAKAAGADAIHPGYGFLSESAKFATQVADAGLTWIGPPPASIETMGSKVESKKMMADAGVPVLSRLDPDQITEAELPVLVKASAGGGGRGMRVVRKLADLTEEIESAAREAGSAFGDSTVFCERYVETGRHIEVQVMSDQHGTTWALGERECSVQRRHQKVIEEAPSPLVERIGQHLRDEMLTAARSAASTIGYVGAGTVEFLADHDGSFFFLEMNTRLQVEHPVTENTTGLDLVGMQLDVANGLPLEGPEPTLHGYSIEVRLYAEDASADWQPQSGALHRIEIPEVRAEFAPLTERGIRLDSGVVSGSEVSTHYDPMLAKVIATAPTRTEAARILASALQRAHIHGLITNRDLLVGVLREPDFLSGHFDTGYFGGHEPAGLAGSAAGDPGIAALAAAVADAVRDHSRLHLPAGIPAGFRNVPAGPATRTYTVGENEHVVSYRWGRHGIELDDQPGVQVVAAEPSVVTLEVDGVEQRLTVTRYGTELVVVDTADGAVALRPVPRFVDPSQAVAAGSLVAPMPGSVTRIAVEEGQQVEAGAPLLWLEAMKMEHVVRAVEAGVVEQIAVSVGQQVEPGTVLAVVGAGEQEEDA